MASSPQQPSAQPIPPPAPRSSVMPPTGFKQFKEKGNYAMGWILIGCALVDAVVDPFAGLSAPALLGSGMALIGVDKISDIFK